MTQQLLARLVIGGLCLGLGCTNSESLSPTSRGPAFQDTPASGKAEARVVRVVAPTGDPAMDVPNIRAAVDAVTPGGVVQFAHGTYVLAVATQFIVSTPGVTIQGDRRGTTLRSITSCCSDDLTGEFLLIGGNQTIRGLKFEGFGFAVSIGAPGSTTGGYRLEKNVFRNGHVGFDFVSSSSEVSTVEGNTFENLTTAYLIAGNTVHFLHNLITITDPTRLVLGQPLQGGVVLPEILSGGTVCENNVFEENTMVRQNDAFLFYLPDANQVCRNNIVRNNRIIDARIYDVIAPLFDNGTMVFFLGPGQFEGNLVQDNVLQGSEGVGLVLETGSGNRIIGNEFRDLPGQQDTYSGYPGTAIILGAATSGNRVRGNEFENVVNTVVDLGTGNTVRDSHHSAAMSVQRTAQPASPTNTANARLQFLRSLIVH